MPTNNNTTPFLTDSATNTLYFSNYLPTECPKLYKHLQKILKDNNGDCKVVRVPDATEAVSKGGALNCISWNVRTQSGIQKFRDEYNKLAHKVVKEQQKNPLSLDEVLSQIATTNGISPEEYIKEMKKKNKLDH